MMRELHHRVKNNLQIVSSLLNLQTYRLKDEASITALNESKLRVQAMSLIHQRLYRAEDASLVNFKLFVTDLTETLMSAYGYEADEFDLQIDIRQEMLEVDAVLPIGLMVNEILTNSFKYAYKEVQRPMLKIRLMNNGNHIELEIADNGPGRQIENGRQSKSGFGTSLIDAFTKQLHATCNVTNDGGMAYHFEIPYTKQKVA
jgi:two-component sensor histidine kinase